MSRQEEKMQAEKMTLLRQANRHSRKKHLHRQAKKRRRMLHPCQRRQRKTRRRQMHLQARKFDFVMEIRNAVLCLYRIPFLFERSRFIWKDGGRVNHEGSCQSCYIAYHKQSCASFAFVCRLSVDVACFPLFLYGFLHGT